MGVKVLFKLAAPKWNLSKDAEPKCRFTSHSAYAFPACGYSSEFCPEPAFKSAHKGTMCLYSPISRDPNNSTNSTDDLY
ncbi:Transcription initiation factor TFIID subunit 6 [Fusarium oxysporum f. sp. albedinis]|nr:Transcription initiation factor TFIID subunit 6 [Fusarium oxysporum f. sp. albedinis]